MGRLDGKVAIVTGAARGSGALIAERLVGEGARVVVADILDDRGKPVAEKLGRAARYQHLDITDEQHWQAVVDFTLAEFGALTTLVNNAAVLHVGPIEHTSAEEFARVLRVNDVGTFLGVRTVIEPMRAAGGGSIINVSSISGHHPAAGTAAYATSKFGVRGLTKVAALELGRYGIRVNSVNPAMGNPEMVLESLGLMGSDVEDLRKGGVSGLTPGKPILRRGEMADVANAVAFLTSDESSFFNGADFDLDGGISAGSHLPGGIPGAPQTDSDR
ncbi:glucose 1-dehydrogenase [Myxococcota bacterium]|nr:glucose 1-dehydrogenase [Myxococcota bacterium]